MKILSHPTRDINMRDPLDQWLQAAYDPESPESIASADRSREAQRSQRIAVLAGAIRSKDLAYFDRLFLEFFRDDPAILSVMSARIAAKATVRRYRCQREVKA